MRTRFAPSPTGPLHLGHAYAAILAHDMARRVGGEFLLRIEDIDPNRARPEWEAAILEDLRWLGLGWETPVMRQSARMAAYGKALDDLWRRGLVYPCVCTRADIANALSAPQEGAPAEGPDGPVYPGTCRPTPQAPLDPTRPRPRGAHLRLNMQKACALIGAQDGQNAPAVTFTEIGQGPAGEGGLIATNAHHLCNRIGDVILARRDFGTSYHLSVVVDDAFQGITHVTRGHDLFAATPIHVLLQRLLQVQTPTYCHHDLIRDQDGRRLAKRDDARALRTYREAGASPADIRRMIGLD